MSQSVRASAPDRKSSYNTGARGSATDDPSTSNNIFIQGNKQRDRRNWYLYQLFVRQEYVACLSVIETQLRESGGACEYALYLKGLLKRQEGKLTESLMLLHAAVLVNPINVISRKQLGRAQMLMGQYKDAIEAFEEVNVRHLVACEAEDWECFHCLGLCYAKIREYEKAIEALSHAIEIQHHDDTHIKLAEIYLELNDPDSAIETYKAALALSPENPRLLSFIGQQYLRKGQTSEAFDYLGRCLAFDPGNVYGITGAASIIQEAGDYDVALSKYRVAVSKEPNSPQIWNNIGACFYGKKKFYAALACLRKAHYLRPFEWVVLYNTGLVHLSMGRYVSAFHCLSTAISLNAKNGNIFMYLGVCLSLMNDIQNACAAYEKALAFSDGSTSPICRLNYAVTLFNSNMRDEASEQLNLFQVTWLEMPAEQRQGFPQAPFIVGELGRVFQQGSSPQQS